MRARINLLPPEVKARRKMEMLIFFAVTAAIIFSVILVLIYGVFFVQTYQEQATLDKLKGANEQLSKVTSDLQVFRRRQDQLEKQKKLILTLQKMQINWPDLLNDIALLLPNEVWLTDIKVNIPTPADVAKIGKASGGNPLNELKLTGYSIKGQTAVAKTLSRLSDLQMLKNVSLNFSQESNYGQRRLIQFEIRAEINLPKELLPAQPSPSGQASGSTPGESQSSSQGSAGSGGGEARS